jgi:hypothetical protein
MKDKRVRIGRLDTVAKVGAEIRRVYAKVRNGDIPETADGQRLVSMLLGLKQALEVSEFERRLAAIESARGLSKPVSVVTLVKAAKP